MSDMPKQTLIQQSNARPVSPAHLETLGKTASRRYREQAHETLREAVVEVVKEARLSPEQVRRVVEFANQDAYIKEFEKAGSTRVVHFEGGPASPNDVLQDLNDGGGGTVFDTGDGDYSLTPKTAMQKTAAEESPGGTGYFTRYEDDFWGQFKTAGADIPYANPLQELHEAWHLLTKKAEIAADALTKLEFDFEDASENLYQQVKQATLAGTSLGDVAVAWGAARDADLSMVKAAFMLVGPRLVQEGVLSSDAQLADSLQKTAHRKGRVNTDHALPQAFREFTDVMGKFAEATQSRDEYQSGADRAAQLLKEAGLGGALGAIGRGVTAVSKGIDSVSKPVAKALVGDEHADAVAKGLARATKLTGVAGGALAVNAGAQQVTERPTARRVRHAVASVVPGTEAYNMRLYRIRMGM